MRNEQRPTAAGRPITRRALLARCNGSEKLLRDRVTIFLKTHRAQIAAIEDAIRQSDSPHLEQSAQAVKVALVALGAEEAAQAALQLERIARDGRFDHVGAAYADLVEALGPVTAALAVFVGWSA